MTYFYLVIGFVLLIKGADLLVEGAVSVAKRYGLSDLVIGLTIVSFGTSMPELLVGVYSVMDGNTEIAIGNVLGSSISNVLLILGVSALIYPLNIQKATVLTEVPFSLMAALMVGFFANVTLFNEGSGNMISQYEGGILLFFFFLFMLYIARMTERSHEEEEEVSFKKMPIWRAGLLLLLGSVGLFFGGEMVVDNAVSIAAEMGMSQSLIGLTVVAIGTSLPELVTSAMAAYRKKSDIAVGNVVGSNIFNLFWILGITSTISPLPYLETSNMDIFIILVSCILLMLSIGVGKRNSVDRFNGMIFILVYILYIIYIVQRG